MIATGSEDQTVQIWKLGADGNWNTQEPLKFSTPVWRVSWSQIGIMLAVSTGDNEVKIYKENQNG